MPRKNVPIPVMVFIWLAIIGGVFWWRQGRDEEKETREVMEKPSLFKESGSAALVKPEPESKPESSEEKSALSESDERKIADFKMIRMALEMYYQDHNKYPISFNGLMPDYFSTDLIFQDKHWIDNRSDTQKYCLWFKLDTGKYFIGCSNLGTAKVDHLPSGLDECFRLTNP